MHRYRIAWAALLLASVLIAPASTHAQQPAPDAATIAADEAARQAAAAAGPRFDPTAFGVGACLNEPSDDARVGATVPPGVDLAVIPNAAGWIVSSPRGSIRPGGSVTITLRDKAATKNRMVYADVTAPDGTTTRAGSTLFADGTAKLAYPSDFRSAAPTAPGTYTVVWRDTMTDRFIACDGFVGGR